MRIFLNIALFSSVLFAPFWCTLLVSLVGIFLIPRWYEVVAAYALFELLFRGVPMPHAPDLFIVPLSAYALLLVLANEWMRRRIRERTI